MPDDNDIFDLVTEWQKKFGETLMMGWGVKPHHTPVIKRCLEKGDPTEFHELIEKESAEYKRRGIVL